MSIRHITDPEPDNKVHEYYTVFGSHDYLDNKNYPRLEDGTGDVLAKSITLGDNTR